MAFSRRLGVVGILGISWFVAIGCGDDDGTKSAPGDGGEAGEAPVGGKTFGGSSTDAGNGGVAAAGEGGVGGSGGTVTAGMGGDAGEKQVAAGAGGEVTAPVGGAGGAPGAGGAAADAGGEGGVPALLALKCGASCDADDQCKRGVDASQKCSTTTHRCEQPIGCTTDTECQPQVSFWSGPCASDAECADGSEWCVAWAGAGYCAPIPDPESPDFPCTFGEPTTLPRFNTEGNVSVCANPDPRCFDGQCTSGCGDVNLGGCGIGTGDTCSATTGFCECETGDECLKSGICSADHHCAECDADDDCKGSANKTGLDICVDGKCGCSGSAVCLNPYSGATPLCE